MTAILYPVAETAEAALHAPLGYAARERDAEMLATTAVHFAVQAVGPAFATRDAALAAYGGDGPTAAPSAGRRVARLDEAHGLRLTPVLAAASRGRQVGRSLRTPLQPTYSDGRRWPTPAEGAAVLWRLSISYWRMGAMSADAPTMDRARRDQRTADARDHGSPVLNALARQPLRPVKPQQPLDIGLFEVRPPEAPDTLIPDE